MSLRIRLEDSEKRSTRNGRNTDNESKRSRQTEGNHEKLNLLRTALKTELKIEQQKVA